MRRFSFFPYRTTWIISEDMRGAGGNPGNYHLLECRRLRNQRLRHYSFVISRCGSEYGLRGRDAHDLFVSGTSVGTVNAWRNVVHEPRCYSCLSLRQHAADMSPDFANCTYDFPHTRHQDCERSFHANIRISVVETSSSVISTSVVVAIGVLPLLVFSTASTSATYYIQTVTSCTLWAVLLSLMHGLMLAPTLLLLCGEDLTMQPRSAPNVFAGVSWRLRAYDIA